MQRIVRCVASKHLWIPRNVRGMKVYTKTGDKGTSLLFNGERRSKEDPRFHALGAVDELNAHVAVAKELLRQHKAEEKSGLEERSLTSKQLFDILEETQSRLLDVGAHIATPLSSSQDSKIARTEFPAESVASLEGWIDSMDAVLPPLRNFILPGGGLAAAQLQVTRAVTRRAERHVVPLVQCGDTAPVVGRYLNRLSDFFFVASRFVAAVQGHKETVYRKV